MNMIACPNCNLPVPVGAAFCDHCGMSMNAVLQASDELLPDRCPNCNATVRVGDLFCDNCGHALPRTTGFPHPPQRPAVDDLDSPSDQSASQLIIQPGGNVLALMPDKDTYVIGREDPVSGSYPDVDLVPFGGEEGGVSRRHAQITRSGDQYFIEDLNSVNYTFVNNQKIALGVAHPLQSGDEIRLGRVLMRFKSG